MGEGMKMPLVKLGSQGLEVSTLGFGCMTLSGVYNAPVDEASAISIVKHAFANGVTFFDTSDMYGPYTSEILLGKAMKQLPREEVKMATKFGITEMGLSGITINGSAEYTRACCEASLKRLDVNYIDLFYIHRVDKTIPIEVTMRELKKLVEEGKIKYVGISEASSETIRRAHAVHPITAVQIEWSLWSRDVDIEIIPTCRELGIGIVTYSPLGRGFFGGKGVTESLPAESFVAGLPRFSPENLERNKILYMKLEKLAGKHQCTTAQLALAWVLHRGNDVVPIPGTTKVKNLDSNIGSLKIRLTEGDLKEITDAFSIDDVAGSRFFFTDYTDTPLEI
ncbi:hypothetical protein LUZ60_010216 [Juncus effusus]|nr:hypothetical protein LUZ60_010216 [Juncus effusus]